MQTEGYCECGCGERAPIATRSRPDRGWIKGKPKRYVPGHQSRRNLVDRFWAKVQKQEGGCWLWMAAHTSHGYGVVRIDGRNVGAHRVAYEMVTGPVPSSYDIDHLCRTPACVNPAHLEAVTHLENVRRGMSGAYLRARTHCIHGHPFDEKNTYWTTKGHRRCRACKALRQRSKEDR